MSLSFHIRETYKKITKQTAIDIMRLRWGGRNKSTGIPEDIKSIVILAQERYGDLIVTTPLFKKLRHTFPNVELTVLGVTDIIDFLKQDNNINFVCNIKKADKKTRNRIFSTNYDILFNTKDHPSFTFIKLSGKINARFKFGISHERHHGFFDYLVKLDDALPTVEKNLSLVRHLGIETTDADQFPYLPEGTVSDEIQEFVKSLAGKKLTGINLSASNRSKEWGVERWQAFLEKVNEEVIILSTADHLKNKRFLEDKFAQVIPSPQTATIFDVAYLVKHMRVLVTPDTSLVHIASCYNKPIVALYRLERDMKKFKPLSQTNRIIVTSTGVIDDIIPEDVLKLYYSVLETMAADDPNVHFS